MIKLQGVLDKVITSPVNYWGSYLGDIAAVAFFFFYGLSRFSGSVLAGVGCVVAGLAFWSLLEYVLHRWVFHGPPSPARRGHSRHHQQPEALVGSPMLSAIALIFLLWVLLRLVMRADMASFLAMGVTLGYFYFTVVHHILHHWRGSEHYFSRLHRYHHVHHRVPRVNYGSTTVFWDRVFGTFDPGDSA